MADNSELVVDVGSREIRAVYADELGAKMESGPACDVPQEAQERAKSFMDNCKADLEAKAEAYGKRLAAARAKKRGDVQPQIGEPTVGPYVALDVLSQSPIEIFGPGVVGPIYQPQKIIASGTICLSLAVIWINPFVDVPNGFAVPANIQLGGNTANLRFDHVNLSSGSVTPWNYNIPLGPAPVPPLILWPHWFMATAPNPQLVEQHVTLDIQDAGKPYAAFGTHVFDLDAELPWFGGFPTPVPPQWEHDIPTKFMVYPR